MFKKTVVLLLVGCIAWILLGSQLSEAWGAWGSKKAKTGETTKSEMTLTEENHARLLKDTPTPSLEYSQERRNLLRRLMTFNTPDKIAYIYLVSFGKVMAFYTVKGKVSSVNSLLTTPDQILDDPNTEHRGGSLVINSPQLDGSYGTNGNAIFFFTTEDIYVEWNGEYMLCDQPLKLATPPELVYVKELKK